MRISVSLAYIIANIVIVARDIANTIIALDSTIATIDNNIALIAIHIGPAALLPCPPLGAVSVENPHNSYQSRHVLL